MSWLIFALILTAVAVSAVLEIFSLGDGRD
jgi:hypothetical protein